MFTTYYGVVHPWFCDHMGHLTTRQYVGMFDDSHWHFFAELGVNPEDMRKRGQGFADVKSVLEYKQELVCGDLVVIKGSLLELGNKSFVHSHEMYNRGTSEIAATMQNTTVAFDLQKRKAVPLFDEFRKVAEEYLKARS